MIKSPLTAKLAHFSWRVGRHLSLGLRNQLRAQLARQRGNGIHAFWWNYRANFGDMLTCELLDHFGFTAIHEKAEDADIVVVGSILEMIPEDFDGLIVGSGLMSGAPRRLSRARVLALRGELTRDLIGANRRVPLGDPGLLASRLQFGEPDRHYSIGIVPHYNDSNDLRIRDWKRRLGEKLKVISVERDPAAVLSDIRACEVVLSSSLHGLICADALGIPNGWIHLSSKVAGGGFKFADYASAIGRTMVSNRPTGSESYDELMRWAQAPSPRIAQIADDLEAIFLQLKASYNLHLDGEQYPWRRG